MNAFLSIVGNDFAQNQSANRPPFTQLVSSTHCYYYIAIYPFF